MRKEDTKNIIGDWRVGIDEFDDKPKWLGSGLDDGHRLRMSVPVNEESFASFTVRTVKQRHRFGCRSGFVEHGGIGDVHAREITHHGLVHE
ncbi:unannotated protein [freshwater metagenome]|uniref:Unannotated protein n=1 Tax=freshwater metagenome TaxID=449393 RepID=A0A6J6JKW5_9ZZZZ